MEPIPYWALNTHDWRRFGRRQGKRIENLRSRGISLDPVVPALWQVSLGLSGTGRSCQGFYGLSRNPVGGPFL